ncbi:MAG: leucine-rich repeat domain-containing protein, partial [Flavobacteriales bacterium]|nr:leucine-rich repeat domain-containing protein [Flavobacteriales bacterium]
SSLTSVVIPNSVTSIGGFAFEGCSGLTAVHITDLSAWCKIKFDSWSSNPTSYAHHLYLNGEEITNLVIPDDITSIEKYAFSGCSGLTSVSIPSSVTSIGDSAFSGCSGLTSVTIPNSVTSIGDWAFRNCSGLTSVTIGNSVTSIGNYAFDGCSGLTSITIPNSVTSIGIGTFSDCSSLKNLRIEDGDTELSLGQNLYDSSNEGQGLFFDCALDTLYLGRNLKYDTSSSYGYSPFANNKSLTSVTIGNSVTCIGKYAFYKCSGLTSVTIPNSVTRIGDSAFLNCNSLVTVHCRPVTPPTLWEDVFRFNASGRKIYVPAASVEDYKTAANWSTYADDIIGE